MRRRKEQKRKLGAVSTTHGIIVVVTGATALGEEKGKKVNSVGGKCWPTT